MTTLISANRKMTLGLALGVIASRLLFLGHGYGTDPDAWRAVVAAQRLLETGVYVPSRSPGNPLVEYVLAAMLAIGLGSSFWIGLVTAILSGVAVALLYVILWPLGPARAFAGSAAFAFTPAVYVAGLGAMDYLWGVTFFLAASLCASRRHVWPAAVLLGLAVAVRPTNVLTVIPVVRLLSVPPRRLVAPLCCAMLIALVFYLPEILALGTAVLRPADGAHNVLQGIHFGTVGLFGALGFVGVVIATVSAIRNRTDTVESELLGRTDRWAIAGVVVFSLLFVVLPHESGYLLPALVGLYWLVCRHARTNALWVMVSLLIISCLLIKVDEKPGRTEFVRGPVLWEVHEQKERRCLADRLKTWLTRNEGYVAVGYFRPQLAVEMGRPYSDRIMYVVRPHDDGLRDTEFRFDEYPDIPTNPRGLRPGAELQVLDRALRQQNSAWPDNELPVLRLSDFCR